MRNDELMTSDMTAGLAGLTCGAHGTERPRPARHDRNTARRRVAVAHTCLAHTCLVRTRAALTCLALCAVLAGALPALARAETTQLPGGEYPDAQCTSPMRPFAGDKAWEWDLYRQKMGAYRACVDAYVRRARADIEHIQGKIDKAVREYNREVTMP